MIDPSGAMELEGVSVAQWCPTPDSRDSVPTQVHLWLELGKNKLVACLEPGGEPKAVTAFALRLKSQEAALDLIKVLIENVAEVWPKLPKAGVGEHGPVDGPGSNTSFDAPHSEQEEGELNLMLGVQSGHVMMHFGKRVLWFGMPPKGARELAALLVRNADAIDKKGNTV